MGDERMQLPLDLPYYEGERRSSAARRIAAEHAAGVPVKGCNCPRCHGARERDSRVAGLDDGGAVQPLVPGAE